MIIEIIRKAQHNSRAGLGGLTLFIAIAVPLCYDKRKGGAKWKSCLKTTYSIAVC